MAAEQVCVVILSYYAYSLSALMKYCCRRVKQPPGTRRSINLASNSVYCWHAPMFQGIVACVAHSPWICPWRRGACFFIQLEVNGGGI